MKLTFIGAVHEVTGSNTLIEIGEHKYLVDYGLEQGKDIYVNIDLPVAPSEIDAIFLTHAHIDHSGRIPQLVAQGFKGPVFCTLATQNLCNIMLQDSAHIQESEAEWKNRKALRAGEEPVPPIYTLNDALAALKLFKSYLYHEKVKLNDNVSFEFFDAGHLLGSSSILLTLTEDGEERTILFSGDIGNVDRPLVRNPESAVSADYIVIESTYGTRLHGDRPDYKGQLTQIIQETLDRGGNVVIPSFAVGRTQELLYLLREIKEENRIKNHDNFPVYVDSPLAVGATRIYDSSLEEFLDEDTINLINRGVDPINFIDLKLAITSDDSKMINFDPDPKVILSASGMCEAGRIRHHLKHNLWKENSTVLFVGYQTEGTLGRKLIEGAEDVKLFGEEVAVNCRIEKLKGISGHADQKILLEWLSGNQNEKAKVFVNHGSDEVCDEFASIITEKFNLEANAPYSGDQYDLITGECVYRAPIVKAMSKKSEAHSRAVSIYNKLVEAGKRLLRLIDSKKGASNKEISKLTDKINSLCEKYE